MQRGKISITSDRLARQIRYIDAEQNITLALPLEYSIWWNYSHNDSLSFYTAFVPSAKAGENDIHVYLEIEDAANKRLVFHEKIKFGGRFPNEANYFTEPLEKGFKTNKTNRVDKILAFFLENLTEQEFR